MKGNTKVKIISSALSALGLMLLSGCAPQSASFTADDLYGIWTEGGHLYQFNEDGTFAVTNEVSKLASEPLEFGEFRLEGTRLTHIRDEENWCSGITAIYEIDMEEDGSRLRRTIVEDACKLEPQIPSVFLERYSP